MAEIGFSSSVLTKLTKKLFTDGVIDQMIEGAPLMEWIRKPTIVLGTDMTSAIGVSWPEGLGNRTDRQKLPDANAPDYLNPNWDTVDTYQTLEITGKEIQRTKGKAAAMANYLDELLSKGKKNHWRDMEFQGFNDATGLRGVTNGVVAAGALATVTLSSSYTPIRGLRTNMVVDFYAGASYLTTAKITSVSILAGTFVVDELDVALPDAMSIYMNGNYQNEINGLGNLINNSSGPATVLGLSSSQPLWQSQVLTNSGTARPLSTLLLDQMHFRIKNENDEDPTDIWCDNITQMVAWVQMVNRAFMVNAPNPGRPTKINAHNEVESFGNAKVHTSSLCPNNKIFFMQGSDFKFYIERPYSPILEEKAGNMWQLKDDYNMYQAKMWQSAQMVLGSRRLHGYVGDLATS